MAKKPRQRIQSEELLSTGMVADICDVSRDTVLKWVKSGKVRSFETPGGHYKVPRSALSTLLKATSSSEGFIEEDKPHVYCWEYHAKSGVILDECKTCIVYRSKARRCFDLASLPTDAGHSRLHCEKDCDECNYYRLVHGQRPNVIIVTSDNRLRNILGRKVAEFEFNLDTAENEYNCCLLINDFRPDFVIIDNSLTVQRRNELIKNLHDDPRLPLIRIVLNVNPGKIPKALQSKVFAFMKGSITARSLTNIVKEFPVAEKHEVASVAS